ncbi:MAG: hypothetical protein IPP17_19425 [Bacteroidetes bacterium]|nr:hypothetical protein [Bacteroidota bacterium]
MNPAVKRSKSPKTHWYALKAIAHKIAYQDAIHKADPPQMVATAMTNGKRMSLRLPMLLTAFIE